MKINNNLNNEKINLKQKAQTIVKSISKYNFLNDQEILKKIENAILNTANDGETEFTFYLRQMPKGYTGAHGFVVNSIVIDLNEYPTTTFKEVLHDFVQWCVSKGFDKEDVTYTLPNNAKFTNEPLIYSITVDWSEKKNIKIPDELQSLPKNDVFEENLFTLKKGTTVDE